ncbi:MAG: hypothetical protein IKV61_03710 [Clostridia bacterium]|nr:hypothetical protein [Clostridia bacterium]
MNLNDNNCFLCNKANIKQNLSYENAPFLYCSCEECGQFFIPDPLKYYPQELSHLYNIEHLRSYLFYHKSNLRPVICDGEYYNAHISDNFINVYNVSPELVESWYPKTFAEKVDLILLKLYNQIDYIGHNRVYNYIDLKDIFFVCSPKNTPSDSIAKKYFEQIDYYIKYLKESEYISYSTSAYVPPLTWGHKSTIALKPKGLARIEELQKNQSSNKNVFIAMSFGEGTKELREKIKEGLKGYNVRIMDEIEHNNQIVPEMLYEIRNSRFVIAELSHHNNGAYYEAGYALGLGKEVIHICDKKELKSGLHFDVAQVNTIFYDSIDEIPEKLRKRIEATIK